MMQVGIERGIPHNTGFPRELSQWSL